MNVNPAAGTVCVDGALVRHHDWFLRNSHWDDIAWIFAPTSPLEEDRPVGLRWDFLMPSGRRFTDAAYAALLECARKLVATKRSRGRTNGLPHRASSMHGFFNHLRALLRWMDAEGHCRFDDLDAAALAEFVRSVERRTSVSGKRISPVTVSRYLTIFDYLYRYREELGDGLTFDPWPGQGAHAAAGVHKHQRTALAYTPDSVSVPLIQGAIDFLATSALHILGDREIYASAIVRARTRGLGRKACRRAALRALNVPSAGRGRRYRTITNFYDCIDELYGACFIVIAYLVGPRVSEIAHLQSGCIQPFEGTTAAAAVLTGAIFKLESGYHGRAHQWVAPEPAVHAVSVLEALSAPHRYRASRSQLCLRTREGFRTVSEWEPESTDELWIPRSERLNDLIKRFARRLNLPRHQGKPWTLTTHQGRKTFARFVALRDRTSLFALAQHLGHRDRLITDASYVGTDYALQREIDAEVLEQSVDAWEHMLSTPHLGGRAGAELDASRPRFSGRTMKQDLKSYARLLAEAGLTLGVCDWGFCIYRQDYSACRGDAFGPSAERREPSTCARCKNFVATCAHGPYWQDQVERHEALLRNPALPTQTLKIARERLNEALSMTQSISGLAKRKQ
jgi:integrase